MNPDVPPRILLIGCGAVACQYYLPMLRQAEASGLAKVHAAFDPDPTRAGQFVSAFPGAKVLIDWSAALREKVDLAIVASPQRFHAEQTLAMIRSGCHVLCEKPMSSTVEEAQSMVAAAAEEKVCLAVGHYRRFFPVSQFLRESVRNGALGTISRFEVSEGGAFQWPAASESFFRKTTSAGGVLADAGVHVLDLLQWWFGEPERIAYADDSRGGLEANCRLELAFPKGISGVVQLSRESSLPNRWSIHGDRASVEFGAAAVTNLEWRPEGSAFSIFGETRVRDEMSFDQATCFGNQFLNVLAAIRGEEALVCPGEDGLGVMKLVERCYRERMPLPEPWAPI